MPDVVIRLDKSKPFSENLGEMAPDDPLYRVRFWQGQKVKGHMVLLPFDAHGNLVPDDGKTTPFQGMGPDGKPLTYHPLYSDAMRALVESKTKKAAAVAKAADEDDEEAEAGEASDPVEDVNLESWLRGEARYEPHLLRKAARARFGKNYGDLKEMVVELVLDEKIVPEAEVCAKLAVYLPAKAA